VLKPEKVSSMSKTTVELKAISVAALAELMESSAQNETESLKEWEDMGVEKQDAVKLIITEMLIGMTKDFSWLPASLDFKPEEKNYIDVHFMVLMSEVVQKVIEEKKEQLATIEEARIEVDQLLESK
jgi:hypothetical protein